MLCVTAPYRYMYILFSVWVRQNHTAPQRDRSDPISTLPHTAQAFLCPTPAFPCTQGDSDPPWSRQLMTTLLATGSSAFSAQTALLKTIFFLCHCSVAQLGPTLCNRTDCSTPRFPLCLIFNIFVESVVMLLLFCFGFLATRHVGSSPPTVDSTHSPALGGKVFTTGPPGKPP